MKRRNKVTYADVISDTSMILVVSAVYYATI